MRSLIHSCMHAHLIRRCTEARLRNRNTRGHRHRSDRSRTLGVNHNLTRQLLARTHVSALLLMDTPEGGWEAYYADNKSSETEKKKPAHGAGSSRLISDDAPVSPLAKQPKFEKARNSCMNESTSGFSLTSDDHLPAAPPTERGALDASARRLVGRTTSGSGAS